MRRWTTLLAVPLLLAACTNAGGRPDSPSSSLDATASGPATAAPHPTFTVPPSPGVSSWVAVGAFNEDRVGTQLVLLDTGEVLAAGNDNLCGVESPGTDTAEIWDPTGGTWTMTDRLPGPRNMLALVGVADGRALVTGGANADYVAKSSTVVFDVATHTWTPSGLLNTARMNFAAAPLADGRVLVAGGLLIDWSQDGRALRSVEIWDPVAGTWSESEPLSSPRMSAVAVRLADGRVLVVGGVPSWGGDVPLATAEVFDPATGRWTPAGTLMAPRREFSLVALPDGGALVIGGEFVGTVVEDGQTFHPPIAAFALERLDPVTNVWTQADGIDTGGRRPAAVAMADGRVLVVAGAITTIYDPATAAWSETVPIPDGRNDAAGLLLDDGSVLVVGGWTEWPPDTPGCPRAVLGGWRYVPAG